jgi:hypothetical protein
MSTRSTRKPEDESDEEVIVEAIEPNAQEENEADVVAQGAPSPESSIDARVFIVNGVKVDANGTPVE